MAGPRGGAARAARPPQIAAPPRLAAIAVAIGRDVARKVVARLLSALICGRIGGGSCREACLRGSL